MTKTIIQVNIKSPWWLVTEETHRTARTQKGASESIREAKKCVPDPGLKSQGHLRGWDILEPFTLQNNYSGRFVPFTLSAAVSLNRPTVVPTTASLFRFGKLSFCCR